MSQEIHHYKTHFNTLKPTFIGNHLPWLRQQREASLARFLNKGFPSRREENWRYTDLTFLEKLPIAWGKRDESLTKGSLSDYCLPTLPCYQLVFVDGYFSAFLSDTTGLPEGVSLHPLNELLLFHPEQAQQLLVSDTQFATEKLLDLNSAFISDGVCLQVQKNTVLDKPLQLLFLATESGQTTMANIRNYIILGENSQATIIEEHTAIDDVQQLKTIFNNITLQDGSQLNYYKLQNEAKKTIHLAYNEIRQARDSQFNSFNLSLGGKLARENLHIELNETGANCQLNGFYAASQQQHIDHHTRIDHYAPHCSSNECYKGILNDQAVGVFNGKVVVHKNAQKTQSQQINKSLLLAKTAVMNTKPELEIYADDVKCAHGATVGQIDPEALFYLQSRGVDKPTAISLLVEAFCQEVFAAISPPEIAEYFRGKLC